MAVFLLCIISKKGNLCYTVIVSLKEFVILKSYCEPRDEWMWDVYFYAFLCQDCQNEGSLSRIFQEGL